MGFVFAPVFVIFRRAGVLVFNRSKARPVQALLAPHGRLGGGRLRRRAGRLPRRYHRRPMSRSKTTYACNECGAASARWLGKCPSCGAWNSLVETVAQAPAGDGKNRLGERLHHTPMYLRAIIQDMILNSALSLGEAAAYHMAKINSVQAEAGQWAQMKPLERS